MASLEVHEEEVSHPDQAAAHHPDGGACVCCAHVDTCYASTVDVICHRRVEFLGELNVFQGISPFDKNIRIEPDPQTCRISARKGVHQRFVSGLSSATWPAPPESLSPKGGSVKGDPAQQVFEGQGHGRCLRSWS